MIKIELTPYERSVLDTAITYYLRVNPNHGIDPMFKPLADENRRVLKEILEKLYSKM